MKESTIFFVACGTIVLAAASAYFVYRNKKENKSSSKTEELRESLYSGTRQAAIDLELEKERAAAVISERHNAATQIIRETLDEIENYEVDNSKHPVDFDEIDSSLDKLLDEE